MNSFLLVGILFYLFYSIYASQVTTGINLAALAAQREPSSIKQHKTIPNPNENPIACGRSSVKRSAICDPDDLLSISEKDAIEDMLSQIPETKAQVAILIVHSIHPSYTATESVEKATESLVRSVHDAWGVGDAVKNNGVLVFLSVKDRSVYISTGRDVENKLSQKIIHELIDKMSPYLKEGEHFMAFEYALKEIRSLLTNDGFWGWIAWLEDHLEDVSPSGKSWLWTVCVICIAGGYLSYFIYHYDHEHANAMRKSSEAMRQLIRDMSDCHDGNNNNITTCPVCLMAESASNQMKWKLLECDHRFCERCLDAFDKDLSTNKCKCSICNDWSAIKADQTVIVSTWDHRKREFHYRVGRLRSIYPLLITDTFHDSLCTAIDSNRMDTIRILSVQHSAAVQNTIIHRNNISSSRSSVSNGSKSVFGGGKSDGGAGQRY